MLIGCRTIPSGQKVVTCSRLHIGTGRVGKGVRSSPEQASLHLVCPFSGVSRRSVQPKILWKKPMAIGCSGTG